MPVVKSGGFVSYETLAIRARLHRSMAETYRRIASGDDPRRTRAEALAKKEMEKAAEIEREYL